MKTRKYINVTAYHENGKVKEHKLMLGERNIVWQILKDCKWVSVETKQMSEESYNLAFGIFK
jgi:hypothetical protein